MQTTSSPGTKLQSTLYLLQTTYKTLGGHYIPLTSLTHLQIINLHSLYTAHPNTLKVEVVKCAMLHDDINNISPLELDDIYSFIMQMTTFSSADAKEISDGLLVIRDEKYSTPDYVSCEMCQEKGLDMLRNCPLLPKSMHRAIVLFTYTEDKTRVDRGVEATCPRYIPNHSTLLGDALKLLEILEYNVLPISGGMLDQTPFVNVVSSILKPIIDKRRAPPPLL